MPRPPTVRSPKWLVIGQQIRDARLRIDMTQKFLASQVGCHHTVVSKDEVTDAEIPDTRLRGYCKVFDWDYNKIREFLEEPQTMPVVMRAQQEYIELFTLLDGLLQDGEEQDLLDEAIQLVIMHRYPNLAPKDFVPSV